MTAATDAFCRRIASAVPGLQWVLREHLDDNFNELLPHVFFGDVTRWAETETESNPQSAQVARLMEILDSSFVSQGADVRELIEVSFLENLAKGSAVAKRLGPHLRQVFQRSAAGNSD
jgi:hypothetical protein